MNTKICTSIEQSKKLLSLGLDPSTADMYYGPIGGNPIRFAVIPNVGKYGKWDMPAWSLTALLELMPPYLFELERGIDLNIYRNINSNGWHVSYMPNNVIDMQKDNFKQITNGNSPIDAAFEMIVWLIEQKHIKVNK